MNEITIKNKIQTIRGKQVMLDGDLAELYGVSTKVLNQAVKRNLIRFPNDFMFQLSEKEKNKLVTNCDRFKNLKHSTSFPYAFTEHGVAMLSGVLNSETAISVNILIIRAFVHIKKMISSNLLTYQRLDKIEHKQLEHDQKFEKVFKAIESKDIKPSKGVFFNGQVFDAHIFISDLIRSAKKEIILIDNYIDDSVLTLFTKRKKC